MIRSVRLTVCCGILIGFFSALSIRAQDTVDNSTLTGKYMCGYQGWFECPGDGSGGGWFHWFNGQAPVHDNLNTDLFPDLTEYTPAELFATQMHYADNSVVKLYSSYTEATVVRHFKWMKDYNIDGAWIQRFSPPQRGRNNFTNHVLLNCIKGAEKYGRVFVVMYDISSSQNATLFNDITSDWMYLVDSLKILESPRYLKHKGKPLVSVWGFGFTDRQMTADVAAKIIKWFKTDAPEKYRTTFMGGVNDNWQSIAAPWDSVVRAPDIISPWFVGRFGDINGADSWKTNHLVPDVAECKRLGKEYLPVVFPGFSWSNMHHGTTPQNQIPRKGGAFYWEQVYNAVSAGATTLYGAMFDEVDEGTAILKGCTKKSLAPSDGYWLTFDADGYNLPSDWYLRLAGEANKLLKGKRTLSKTMPLNPNKPDSGITATKFSREEKPSMRNIFVRNGALYLGQPFNADARVTVTALDGRIITATVLKKGSATRLPLIDNGLKSSGAFLVQIRCGSRVIAQKPFVFAK
jgi:hypothetical protein